MTLPSRLALALLTVLLASSALATSAAAETRSTASTAVQERSGSVSAVRTFRLVRPVTHVAVHWRGRRSAHVDVAFSRDGRRFGRLRHVELDEVGRRVRDGETYGEVMVARGVRAVRVVTDRRLRLTVLGMTDRGRSRQGARAAGHVTTTPVISRSGWGADESLRFDRRKREIWPPEFWDVQKLVVHHTAGENDDPDPPATIRSIYHYHAVTQRWGDIGYNFLVDEAGRVYEGRYSGPAGEPNPPVDPTPGEDAEANGVTGGHAYGYNAGTVGIALLGTLSDGDAAAAARTALEESLAWGSERHGLDPLGAGTYTNPVTLNSTSELPNILGHRDVSATECPGEILYGTLQQLRDATAQRLALGSAPTFSLSASPQETEVVRGASSEPLRLTLDAVGEFTGTVSLDADGLRPDAPVSFSDTTLAPGESATITISTTKGTATGSYLLRLQGTFADPETGLRDTRAATVKVQITRR
jgi:hypothetical protein